MIVGDLDSVGATYDIQVDSMPTRDPLEASILNSGHTVLFPGVEAKPGWYVPSYVPSHFVDTAFWRTYRYSETAYVFALPTINATTAATIGPSPSGRAGVASHASALIQSGVVAGQACYSNATVESVLAYLAMVANGTSTNASLATVLNVPAVNKTRPLASGSYGAYSKSRYPTLLSNETLAFSGIEDAIVRGLSLSVRLHGVADDSVGSRRDSALASLLLAANSAGRGHLTVLWAPSWLLGSQSPVALQRVELPMWSDECASRGSSGALECDYQSMFVSL
eukprot:Opistho-2@66987